MKRCTALLCLLLCIAASAQERSDSAVVAWLRSEYGVRFSGNNRLVFFQTGQEKFDDLFAAVRQARKSIHLEYFNFRNDSINRRLFQLLGEKAEAGVEVRALFDGFGNRSNNRPFRRRHLDSIRRHGIEIVEYDPVRFPYINHAFHRDHRKIVVIDGLVAYTGGMNVADYYITGKPEFGEWRDIHCRVEGDVVDELQAIFVNFWNAATHSRLSGPEYYTGGRDARRYFSGLKADTCQSAGSKCIGVVDRVPRRTPSIMRRTFVRAIDAAQEQVQIINPYLTLSPAIRRALKRACKRGVDVQVMISSKSDIPITPRIVEHNAHRLMKHGARVYVFEGGFHHSKIMMVDGRLAFVGSTNLNSRSLRYDYECNLLVADAPSTQGLQNIFREDSAARCWLLTPETWKKNFKPGRRFAAWFWQFLGPFV
ncbi:MAG: cardiolipin synthase [Alloprevotella sp.]|nr:cardiolipin synthase [Alloprevotella sp.]